MIGVAGKTRRVRGGRDDGGTVGAAPPSPPGLSDLLDVAPAPPPVRVKRLRGRCDFCGWPCHPTATTCRACDDLPRLLRAAGEL